jgi:hypothetical protein
LIAEAPGFEIGTGMKMLFEKLMKCGSSKWRGASQHLLIHDCQTIRVRVRTDLTGEGLGLVE